MKYYFDYEEIRSHRFEIEAGDFFEAYQQVIKEIENFKMTDKDFLSGELSMPCDKNFYPYVQDEDGKRLSLEYSDIVLESW